MLFKALFDFEALEEDELNLKAGDTIDAQEPAEGAKWGTGKCLRTGAEGNFPLNYVEKMDPAASAAAPPPIMPRRMTADASGTSTNKNSQSPGSATTTAAVDYTKYPWFAAGFDRAKTEESLMGKPDGTFLVRPSTSHNGFSLSVKFDDIRHIMIMQRGGKYGFSEPCTFDSVLALVESFQRDSLAVYNAELETKLVYPYSTAPTMAVQQYKSEEDEDAEEDLYVSNREALRMARKNRREDAEIKLHDYADIYEEIREDTVKHRAQMQIVMLLKDQRQLADKIDLRGPDHDKIRENRDLLKARLFDAERNLELLDGRLRVAKENYEKGKRDEPGDGAAAGAGPRKSKSSGFREDLDRPTAESMLDGKDDGCYIIRRSKNRTANPYTLSMRFEGKVKHIQIKYDGVRYGLAEPLAFYTIHDLCDYYSSTPLSTTITRCLTVAVNAL
mmetsp:Transcript_36688/g.96060  ORF Transcript_36688/g.96060 Transcript_36688/m.96060 type:complete len:445 (-) Transcript_36688:989-2323(-)